MRDELDARMWNDHHHLLAEQVDRAAARAGRTVSRLFAGETARQLLSMTAAFAITAIGLQATIV